MAKGMRHSTKRKLKAVHVQDVFPDFENWGHGLVQTVFEQGDPLDKRVMPGHLGQTLELVSTSTSRQPPLRRS